MSDDRTSGSARTPGGEAPHESGAPSVVPGNGERNSMTGRPDVQTAGPLDEDAGPVGEGSQKAAANLSDTQEWEFDDEDDELEQPRPGPAVEDTLRDLIENRPLTAVAIAFGVGWFVARLGR